MNLGIETETKIGEAIKPLIYPEVKKVILDGNRWEGLTSNKKIDDVDEELLKQYTNKAHEAGRIAITYTDKETVLNQLELTNGDMLLNAGKALFSDDLIQDVQMAIFATTERLTFNDIQRFHGLGIKAGRDCRDIYKK